MLSKWDGISQLLGWIFFFLRKIAYFGKDMEKLELILIAIGNAKWAVVIEYSLADVQKLNI